MTRARPGSSHAIPFAVVVDDSGKIAATWIAEGDGSRSVVTVSANRGKTWTETPLVSSLQPDRRHPFNGERFPVLAIDGESGLHVAYVTSGAKSLAVRRSSDWSQWDQPASLSNEDVEEVRMAAIDACGPTVHVSWMERRDDVWQAWYFGSRDRGRTWIEPLCVSQPTHQEELAAPGGFQISSDDDQSSVRDDGRGRGRGRVHLVWTIRGGAILHAIIEWNK